MDISPGMILVCHTLTNIIAINCAANYFSKIFI